MAEPDLCIECDTPLEKDRCPKCDSPLTPEADPVEEVEELGDDDLLAAPAWDLVKTERIPPPRRLSHMNDFDPETDKPATPPPQRSRKVGEMHEKLQDLIRDRIVHAEKLRDLLRGNLKPHLKQLTPQEVYELRLLLEQLMETYREAEQAL